MHDPALAENIVEYIIAHPEGKSSDEIVSMMKEVLGQLKEHKFKKLKMELGML